jgi:dinuclear metal center YbgI/SA1388 family protein
MKIKDITDHIESFAPLALQESYDNAGLITGDKNAEVKAALICLDSTEEVIDEAIALGCNLVIAHHPIVFGGLKKINGKNYVERVIIKAIKNDIAIYACHTNLDNVSNGVNQKIASKLGLVNTQILSPKTGVLKKLVTFVPTEHAEKLRSALFEVGCGKIGNYDSCSYNLGGEGTFRANDKAKPFVGAKGELHTEAEVRVETIFESWREGAVKKALRSAHPYEEPAFDIYSLNNSMKTTGSGMVGDLERGLSGQDFLNHLKTSMKAGMVRHTNLLNRELKKVAVCGGSGSFLLHDAIAAGADVFVTADFKYHQFFDAENKIVICDIGHYESEQFTSELFYEVIQEKFTTFALHLSKINTNPINYF